MIDMSRLTLTEVSVLATNTTTVHVVAEGPTPIE